MLLILAVLAISKALCLEGLSFSLFLKEKKKKVLKCKYILNGTQLYFRGCAKKYKNFSIKMKK